MYASHFMLMRDSATGSWELHEASSTEEQLREGAAVPLHQGEANWDGVSWSRPDADDYKAARREIVRRLQERMPSDEAVPERR